MDGARSVVQEMKNKSWMSETGLLIDNNTELFMIVENIKEENILVSKASKLFAGAIILA